MSPGSRTRRARPLALVAGVAAGMAGFAGLGVYLFAPLVPQYVCPGLPQGGCTYEDFSFYQYLGFGQAYLEHGNIVLAEQFVTAALLWVLPFLAIAVGALWEGTRESPSGRVVLWVGTVEVVVATAVGLFFGAFVMFVPGALLAIVASVAAGAYRR
jgi:hypothetical protein